MTVNVVVSFINKKERWKIREKRQSVKDARRRLVSLTTEMCTKGCFTARYLSILITNKWISEKPTRQLITSLKSKIGHSLLGTLSKIAINHATNVGWTNIPNGNISGGEHCGHEIVVYFFTAEDVDDYVQSESNLNNTRGLLQSTAQESERWVFVVNCLAWVHGFFLSRFGE